MSAFDLRLFFGREAVELFEHIGETVVDVGPDLLERLGVLVERLFVVHGDAVAEHDGVGDLHHRRLEVQGQQNAIALCSLDLLRVELAQRGHVHDSGIDDLVVLEGDLLFQYGGRSVAGDALDPHISRLTHRGRFLTLKKISAAHVSNSRLGTRLGPRFHHLVRVFLGEALDRRRRSAVGVAFTQHRVHGRTEAHGEPISKGLLLVILRFFGKIGDGISLGLKLFDGCLQLRDRSADIGQLDDVGVRGLHEFAELREVIRDLLVLGQIVGKVGDDPAGERDVPGLDLDARSPGVGANDGEQGIGRQERRLIGLCPDDLRLAHGASSGSSFAAIRQGSLACPRPIVSRRTRAISRRCIRFFASFATPVLPPAHRFQNDG